MAENGVVTATYREIAERFGIGIEGARMKTKRRVAKGVWRILPGNHPQDIIRVEIPEDEWNTSQRELANTSNDGLLTSPPPQEEERREANDIGTLAHLFSQLSAFAERIIEAEKGRAEAERDAAIAKAALAVAEARITDQDLRHRDEIESAQDRHVAELNAVVDQMKAQDERITELQAENTALKARRWWRLGW